MSPRAPTIHPTRKLALAAALVLGGALAINAVVPRATDHRFDVGAESPGRSHHVTVDALPPPKKTRSATNDPRIIPRPADAWPQAPAGFRVSIYADHLTAPRALRRAPNGDIFLTHRRPGEVIVLRGLGKDGRAETIETYATGLEQPFGMVFYPPGASPQWLYVAETGDVVRFAYTNGDLKARGAPERIAELPGGGQLHGGGHWTRDLALSRDGKKLFVSVGSRSNDDDSDDNKGEYMRADILEMTPEGKGLRVWASGIRNAVGIATSPRTGELWASVNERDELGDDLPPDYITHVEPGGFYGWPWFYIGPHWDPKHEGKHPELESRVIVPDVLLAAHSASMQLVFYEGEQFPAEYRGDIFAPQHGSWNRAVRSGYEVVRVPMDEEGRARGTYEDFVTGFVTPKGEVWGRPVGIAVAADGSLLVSDDEGGCIWRIAWEGTPSR